MHERRPGEEAQIRHDRANSGQNAGQMNFPPVPEHLIPVGGAVLTSIALNSSTAAAFKATAAPASETNTAAASFYFQSEVTLFSSFLVHYWIFTDVPVPILFGLIRVLHLLSNV